MTTADIPPKNWSARTPSPRKKSSSVNGTTVLTMHAVQEKRPRVLGLPLVG